MDSYLREVRGRAGPSVALVAILFATVIAYAPALDGDFHFDDKEVVELNPRIRGWSEFADSATSSAWFAGRPVTELTFAFDAARAGLKPRAFHATSLVLHIATGVLVLLLTRALFRRAGLSREAAWAGTAVAGLFALHPLQTEAVAYVSQRAEVLASLLGVAALLLAFAAHDAATRIRAIALTTAAAVVHALALGAKPVATVVPVVFLVIEAALPSEESAPAASRRRRSLRALAIAAPLLALSGAQAAGFFSAIAGRPDVGLSVPAYSPWSYLLTQARVVPLYLRLLVWPAGQNVHHEITPSAGLLAPPSTIAGAALVLALLLAALGGVTWSRTRGARSEWVPVVRISSLGVVWFLVWLGPTTSLVPLDDAVAEHRVYLASVGLFAAVAALVVVAARRIATKFRPAIVAVGGVAVAVALAMALHARSMLWGDPVALWRDAAEKSPRSARPLLNIAQELEERGDFAGALAASSRALGVAGRRQMEPAMQAIASALLGLHRPAEASAVAARIPVPEPETVVLLTFAALGLGDVPRAERYAFDLVARASTYHRSHEAMGRVLEVRGDLAGARREFVTAAALAPSAEILRHLGSVALRQGDREAGCKALGQAASAVDSAWSAARAAEDAARAVCDLYFRRAHAQTARAQSP